MKVSWANGDAHFEEPIMITPDKRRVRALVGTMIALLMVIVPAGVAHLFASVPMASPRRQSSQPKQLQNLRLLIQVSPSEGRTLLA